MGVGALENIYRFDKRLHLLVVVGLVGWGYMHVGWMVFGYALYIAKVFFNPDNTDNINRNE